MPRGDAAGRSRHAMENPPTVRCQNCGKETTKRKALSDFNLRDGAGKFLRFCPECEPAFVKALTTAKDPTGTILPEGTECELGARDPFLRIRLFYPEGQTPEWRVVGEEEENGGLLVFIRKVNEKQIEKVEGLVYRMKTALKIVSKSASCAFAEPVRVKAQIPKVIPQETPKS